MTYLEYTEVHDTGKTKVWEVRNRNDGSYLGAIRWHAPWRKYVLDTAIVGREGKRVLTNGNDSAALPTLWSEDCLGDVVHFIAARMKERK